MMINNLAIFKVRVVKAPAAFDFGISFIVLAVSW